MTDVRDKNDLAFWFPPLATTGLRVPRTAIVHTDVNLVSLLDGEEPGGYPEFASRLSEAAQRIGYPCFLRTGHTSGKHGWKRTCYVPDAVFLEQHMVALVEFSVMADMFGLPVETWAVRELVKTAPLFRCLGYGEFPVTREFRLFVNDNGIRHVQPYWPPDAIAEGKPDHPDWRDVLDSAAHLTLAELIKLEGMAITARRAVGGGHWSVDFLQAADGNWWLTDMALGDQSFKWDEGA